MTDKQPVNYKKENKKLKEECKNLQLELKHEKILKDMYRTYYWMRHGELAEEFQKYWLTMKIIKKIVTDNIQTQPCERCDGAGIDCGCQDEKCSHYQMYKIHEKIKECEKENE